MPMKECSDATANAKESSDASVNEIVIEIKMIHLQAITIILQLH